MTIWFIVRFANWWKTLQTAAVYILLYIPRNVYIYHSEIIINLSKVSSWSKYKICWIQTRVYRVILVVSTMLRMTAELCFIEITKKKKQRSPVIHSVLFQGYFSLHALSAVRSRWSMLLRSLLSVLVHNIITNIISFLAGSAMVLRLLLCYCPAYVRLFTSVNIKIDDLYNM